jgi:hypothetical protein
MQTRSSSLRDGGHDDIRQDINSEVSLDTSSRDILLEIAEWQAGRKPVLVSTISDNHGRHIHIWTFEHDEGSQSHLVLHEVNRRFTQWSVETEYAEKVFDKTRQYLVETEANLA